MSEIKKVNPDEFGVSEKNAKELTTGLDVVLAEREALIKSYKSVIDLEITDENLSSFKELRLKIVKNRTQGIVKWHATSKAFFLAGGRFCDALKNKEIAINENMESKLMDAEKYFENLEKQRIEKLQQERFELCKKFVETEEMILPNLGDLSETIWSNYIVGLESSFNARIEAEKKAEADRIEAERKESEAKIAYEKEQEKIRLENEKLKKEAEAKEKARLAELKAIEEKEKAAQLERERLAKIEAAKQAELKAKQDKILADQKAAAEKKLKEEKAKADKLQAELKAKQDTEQKELQRLAKEKADKLQAEKQAALAPEKDKISNWISSFECPVIDSKEFSDTGKAAVNVITEKFNAFKKWAETQK